MTEIAEENQLRLLQRSVQDDSRLERAPKTTDATIADFTRRKNWSHSILDGLSDVVHVLSSEHKVLYCSPASTQFLGLPPSEMIGHLFTEFIHVDDVDSFIRDFREAMNMMQPFRGHYRLKHKDGRAITFEICATFYRNCFFGIARQVPVEASIALDRFLELKMENFMLNRQLAELKAMKQRASHQGDASTAETEESNREEEDVEQLLSLSPFVYAQGASTLYGVSENVSLFTGLGYNPNDTQEISTEIEDDALYVRREQQRELPAVVGPTTRFARDQVLNKPRQDKKKRSEAEPTRSCTDCDTTSSPEWRKGPNGPKTLCNACGLRWAKSVNK